LDGDTRSMKAPNVKSVFGGLGVGVLAGVPGGVVGDKLEIDVVFGGDAGLYGGGGDHGLQGEEPAGGVGPGGGVLKETGCRDTIEFVVDAEGAEKDLDEGVEVEVEGALGVVVAKVDGHGAAGKLGDADGDVFHGGGTKRGVALRVGAEGRGRDVKGRDGGGVTGHGEEIAEDATGPVVHGVDEADVDLAVFGGEVLDDGGAEGADVLGNVGVEKLAAKLEGDKEGNVLGACAKQVESHGGSHSVRFLERVENEYKWWERAIYTFLKQAERCCRSSVYEAMERLTGAYVMVT
jgi:hypothetical protein